MHTLNTVCSHLKKAKHNRLVPHWKRLDSELKQVKQGSKDRVTCLDGLMHDTLAEKSRDVKILKSCAAIKPKMDDLSNKFKSGKLDFHDKDIFAFEQFLSMVSGRFILCNFNLCIFNRSQFQPIAFSTLPFQLLTISTYCFSNRPQFRPKLILAIGS